MEPISAAVGPLRASLYGDQTGYFAVLARSEAAAAHVAINAASDVTSAARHLVINTLPPETHR